MIMTNGQGPNANAGCILEDNLLNHPNFVITVSNLSSSQFGQSLSTPISMKTNVYRRRSGAWPSGNLKPCERIRGERLHPCWCFPITAGIKEKRL
jgi:hypothetical protein